MIYIPEVFNKYRIEGFKAMFTREDIDEVY